MAANLEKALTETKLGVDAKKEEDFSTWYTQVSRQLTTSASPTQTFYDRPFHAPT